ncbi:MAG: hypothetical protein A2Y25_01680 [Candidatus Melainabacteria bacterium GWF2_37_15]|nr:MAG: hypothetical protein A2Y25_01680 [Candidatus Melainabacteria bacterium GWF2_37_15]
MQCELQKDWQTILNKTQFLKSEFDLTSKNIALLGAGRYGKVALEQLKKKNYNIICFLDNSPEKQGNEIAGIPVVSPNSDILDSVDLIITTIRGINPEITVDLPSISFDQWYVIQNIDNFKYVRNNLLCDDLSKQTLDKILLAVLTNDKRYYSEVTDFNQYFSLPNFRNNYNEFFIDIGAFVGDSIEKFMWANDGLFKKIIAFEPGKRQYDASQKRIKRLCEEWALDPESISLINAGIGGKESFAEMDLTQSHLTSINLINNEITNKPSSIKITTIDKQLKNIPVTFIKADIEGMEMVMLMGAEQTIVKNKPKLAICVYHNINDLVEISEFLKSLVPEYKMAIRHHSYLHSETVLYCWIED